MSARTGLPEYTDGGTKVWAAKITKIERHPGYPVRLHFGESDKQCDLRDVWVAQNPVEEGGYFVVFDTGGAGYMRADDFAKRFTAVEVAS